MVVLFPRYLQYLLTDFRQTFVTGASRDRDDLITFLGQKVKVQGHAIAAEAHSTRRYRREHSTLPSSATFSSFNFTLILIETFSHSYCSACHCLASGEGIVLSRCVCVPHALVSAVKVMCCIQCSLVTILLDLNGLDFTPYDFISSIICRYYSHGVNFV